MESLTAFDVALLFVFGFSVTMGLIRGFVSELIALLTIVAAFILASRFAEPLAMAFTGSGEVKSATQGVSSTVGGNAEQAVSYVAISVSYGVIFLGTVLAGIVARSLFSVAFQVGMAGLSNRLLGGLFGAARAYLIVLVIVFLMQFTPATGQAWWQRSFFVNTMNPQIAWLTSLVSPALANLKAQMGETLQDMSNQVESYTKGKLQVPGE